MRSRWVLLGLYVSSSVHFLFPMMALLLLAKGLSQSLSSITISLGMLMSAFALPLAGIFLDRGRFTLVFSWSTLCILLGLGSYLFSKNISSIFLIAGMVAFIIGTATTYLAAKRISEGLAQRERLAQSASRTYMVENAGIATSTLLASFLLERWAKPLVIADGLSTLIFGILLTFISRRLHLKLENPDRPKIDYLLGLRLLLQKFQIFIPMILVLVSIFAMYSGLQLYFAAHISNPKQMISLVMLLNAATVVLGSFTLSKKKWKLSLQNQLRLAAVLVALGLALATVVQHVSWIIISTILWSLGETLLYPAISEFVITLFEKHQAGQAVATRDSIFKVALIMSPLSALLLGAAGTSQRAFMVIYAGFPLLAILSMNIRKRDF